MGDKMSQSEIDMLINKIDDSKANKDNNIINGNSSRKTTKGKVGKLYDAIDFRKLNKLQYDNLGALNQIHETFVKSLTNYLTMFLRCNIQSELDTELMEQKTYKQYSTALTDTHVWGIYGYKSPMGFEDVDKEDMNRCFLQVDAAFCNFVIDRSFGGSADYIPMDYEEDYQMAEINKEISKSLFNNILDIYKQAWSNSNILELNMCLKNVEENVQNLNLGVANSEMILIIPFDIFIYQKTSDSDDDITHKASFKIGIPYSTIEPILDKLNISNMLLSHRSNIENDDVKESIKHMPNLVEAYIGETQLTFGELLNLKADDIILFDKKVTEPYSVHIGGVHKYNAKPYQLKNRICLKIV